jgi:hypothetical protein
VVIWWNLKGSRGKLLAEKKSLGYLSVTHCHFTGNFLERASQTNARCRVRHRKKILKDSLPGGG